MHVTPTAIAGDTQSAEEVTAEAKTFAFPFTLLALAAVLGLVLFAVRRFRSHGGAVAVDPARARRDPAGGPTGSAIAPPRNSLPAGEPVLEGQRS